jgi:hypothetical protein
MSFSDDTLSSVLGTATNDDDDDDGYSQPECLHIGDCRKETFGVALGGCLRSLPS